MGLIGAGLRAGLAKKVYEQARKPQNQQRVKDLVSAAARRGRGGGGPVPPGGGPTH